MQNTKNSKYIIIIVCALLAMLALITSIIFVPKLQVAEAATENVVEEIESDTDVDSISTLADKSTTLRGTLKWTGVNKDGTAAEFPLRYVKVEIYDSDRFSDEYLGTTYTDIDGNYSFTFQNDDSIAESGGYDLFLRIYAGDNNVSIADKNGTLYYHETSKEGKQDVTTGDPELKLDVKIGKGTDKGKAFQIGQAMLESKNLAVAMGVTPNPVLVKYPEGQYGGYDKTTKTITISNSNPDTGKPETYASWDFLMHEYAHHIQCQLGMMDTQCVSPKKYNTYPGIIANSNKAEFLKQAYAEAWAICFAYLGELMSVVNVQYSLDKIFTAPWGDELNFESTQCNYGELCTESVVAILFDVLDITSESRDNIKLGSEKWWALTASSYAKVTTLSEFVKRFYGLYPEHKEDMGML